MTFYFSMCLIGRVKVRKKFQEPARKPSVSVRFCAYGRAGGAFQSSSKADGGHVLLRFPEVFHELPYDVSGGTYGIYGRCDLSDFEFALFSVPLENAALRGRFA